MGTMVMTCAGEGTPRRVPALEECMLAVPSAWDFAAHPGAVRAWGYLRALCGFKSWLCPSLAV